MAEVRIELLGPIRAWRATTELALGPARQRAVFATLALRAGHTVTREQLIHAVWGDEAPVSAAGSVHTYISGLRRVFDRTVLTGGRGGYALRVPPSAVDSLHFEHLLNQSSVDEALALWHGDPLTGMTGQFADQQRSRLTELRLKALEQRAEAALQQGEHRELVPELTVLAREHPLRERLRELLMRALDHGGRHTEALEVFRDARATLAAELGVEPGPALRELHDRYLTDAPEPHRPNLHFIAPARTEAIFVGRTSELVRLRAAVDDVCAGRGGSVWLDGDFGIGKTALLTQALSGFAKRRCQLGWAHADELSSPLRAIESCLGTSDDPIAQVKRLCETAPLILVLDDMQWADHASILTWHRLIDTTRRLPLLLMASARGVPRPLVQLRQSSDTVISLGPLPAAEAVELQEAILGVPASSTLRELACGNPRYLIALTEGLLHEDALSLGSGTAELARTFAVPRPLAEALSRKLALLTREAREILRWAALLGSPFTVTDIAALTAKRPSDLLAAFEETIAANVVTESGAHLTFAHPLLRRVCYDEIPAAYRPALHRQAAETLAAAAVLSQRRRFLLGGAGESPGKPEGLLDVQSERLDVRPV